jgi:hypothetical protein
MHKLQLIVRAVGAGVLCAVVTGTPAIAAPPSLADQIMVMHNSAADWHTRLAPRLAALPAAAAVRTVGGAVKGEIVAGTVKLAGVVELTGDTVVVARHVVLSGGALRVVGNGHRLALFPVETLRSDAKAGTDSRTQGTISIVTSGAHGQNGRSGSPGFWGFPGANGAAGIDGGFFFCDGTSGGDGRHGGNGERGVDGAKGEDGKNATAISLSIPDGSTDLYSLTATGGGGGDGGSGGTGGSGGAGGRGGDGGDGTDYLNCYGGYDGDAGDGGWGGNGGDGGWGGTGGDGGNGGNGGAITVTYPAGYDPAWITTDANGGAQGFFGLGGDYGVSGRGGDGGYGGFSWNRPGLNGFPGWDGGNGIPGFPGAQGRAGEEGGVSITQRF